MKVSQQKEVMTLRLGHPDDAGELHPILNTKVNLLP